MSYKCKINICNNKIFDATYWALRQMANVSTGYARGKKNASN